MEKTDCDHNIWTPESDYGGCIHCFSHYPRSGRVGIVETMARHVTQLVFSSDDVGQEWRRVPGRWQ